MCTSPGAEFGDEEDGGVVATSGTDVPLLWFANQKRLAMVLDGYTIVLCEGIER